MEANIPKMKKCIAWELLTSYTGHIAKERSKQQEEESTEFEVEWKKTLKQIVGQDNDEFFLAECFIKHHNSTCICDDGNKRLDLDDFNGGRDEFIKKESEIDQDLDQDDLNSDDGSPNQTALTLMELSKGGEGETTFTGNYEPLWDNTRDLQYGKHWVIKMEAVTRVINEWKQKLASPYGDITLRVPLHETIHRLRTDGEGINSSGIMRDFQKTFLALIDECVLLDIEIGKELGELRRESVVLKSKEENRILVLHDEILKMKASTSDMDELANSINKKTEDLETEVSVAISIAREAENANKDLSAEAKQIKTELSGLQDKIRVLKYEAANWKKRAIDARGEIKYLSFSYNAVELKIKELDEESKLKNDEIATLTSKLNNANNEIQRITEEKKKEYDMLGGSDVQLRAANEGLKQVVQSKDAKIEELKVKTQKFLNYERLRMSHVVGMLEGKVLAWMNNMIVVHNEWSAFRAELQGTRMYFATPSLISFDPPPLTY